MLTLTRCEWYTMFVFCIGNDMVQIIRCEWLGFPPHPVKVPVFVVSVQFNEIMLPEADESSELEQDIKTVDIVNNTALKPNTIFVVCFVFIILVVHTINFFKVLPLTRFY
jgi:hypothetical protein